MMLTFAFLLFCYTANAADLLSTELLNAGNNISGSLPPLKSGIGLAKVVPFGNNISGSLPPLKSGIGLAKVVPFGSVGTTSKPPVMNLSIGSYDAHICEHTSGGSISCPFGRVINITYANYGKTSNAYCGKSSNLNCRATNSVSIVKKRCTGKNSCFLSASNSWFGDPCRGVRKYLEVEYQCLVVSNWNTGHICEGTKGQTIDCPRGRFINITYANYGKTSNDYCGTSSNVNCRATNSISIVKKRCTGKNSCSLSASNSWFGDPCVGIRKYLEVKYQCLSASEIHHGWSYTGKYGNPSKWPVTYKPCGGKRQSPIHLREDRTCKHTFPSFNLKQFCKVASGTKFTITNNGHSLHVDIHPRHSEDYTTSGGGLPGTYIPLQFNFHWGSKSSRGSEHKLNGCSKPMEVQILHRNSKYSTIQEAIKHSDGLAVLGTFFEISRRPNPMINKLIKYFPFVRKSGSSVKMTSFLPLRSLLPEKLKYFYRYMGSLTTPTCNEAVVWTIFDATIPISEGQLRQFRTLLNSNGNKMSNNFRPIQKTNHRIVTRSF